MDAEFHYYITYLIAYIAGYNAKDARIIAHSSQYVDDNSRLIIVNNKNNNSRYFSCQTQTYDINSIILHHYIYMIYHFIPCGHLLHNERADGQRDATIVMPDSAHARAGMYFALKQQDLYLLGIASHAYVDTWAHQNFSYINTNINRMPGFAPCLIPNIGHLDAFILPDLIDAEWTDQRLKHNKRIINLTRFISAANGLFNLYTAHIPQYQMKHKTHQINLLFEEIVRIVVESQQSPINKSIWRQKRYMEFGQHIGIELIPYDKKLWTKSAIAKENTHHRWLNYNKYKATCWYKFNEAAKLFKQQALIRMHVL